MRDFHIVAGLVALLAGFVALFAAKGGGLHRRSGSVFVLAMLAMSSTGAILAALKPERGSLIAGVLTFYLVATAWLAVRRPVAATRGLLAAGMLLALGVGTLALGLGVTALYAANGRVDHLPAQPFFLFGSVGVIAGLGDLRVLRANALQGAARLARHLWRMGFALFAASMAFFLGQARHFPAPLRHLPLLSLPVLIVLATTVYWLLRTLRRRPPRLAPHLQSPATSPARKVTPAAARGG